MAHHELGQFIQDQIPYAYQGWVAALDPQDFARLSAEDRAYCLQQLAKRQQALATAAAALTTQATSTPNGTTTSATATATDLPDVVQTDGPARHFEQGRASDPKYLSSGPADAGVVPAGADLNTWLAANPTKHLWWYFDGEFHSVTKALRIPYVTRGENDEGERTVGYILIGYEGGVAGT